MERTNNSYAAIVLRNVKNSIQTVQYAPVIDALLSGGVSMDEVIFLSYGDTEGLQNTLKRLSAEKNAIFLICDRVLLSLAKNGVERATQATFSGDMGRCEGRQYFLISAGQKGVETVKNFVIPAVDKERGETFYRMVVRTVAAPSEAILSAMSEAQKVATEEVFLYASEKFGAQRVEVVYNQRAPKAVTDEVVRVLASELKAYLYAMEDVSIAEQLANALTLHRYKIAVAESFTAGGVGKALVEIPGASKFYYEGVNAYDNESKKQRLGVTDYTLQNKGAVSSETAYEMATGLLKGGNCDIAVATTGIAGPASDYTQKPVGLCFIAVGTRERVRVFEYHLGGDREEITQTAINLALFLTYKEINHKLYE